LNAYLDEQAMNAHMAKPVEPLRLYEVLMRWLPALDRPGEPTHARDRDG
jgi:hypothetical protein